MARKKRTDRQGRVLRVGESQRSDGHYVYRYTDNGIRKAIYGRDLIELRDREKEIIKNDIYNVDYSLITLNKLYEEYMANVKEKSIEKTTAEVYRNTWATHVYNSIGKRKIKDIKKSEIVKYYSNLQREKGLKKRTIERVHVLLKMTFDYALDSAIIINNPCVNALSYIKAENKQGKRIISEHEQTIIAEYLESNPKYNYKVVSNIFILGCNTGLRISEILALTWNDIDFDNEIINVNKSLKSSKDFLTIGKPKTENSKRQVPMLSEVRKALRKQQLLQFEKGNNDFELDGFSDFVFLNRKGKIFKPCNINGYFNYARYYYNDRERELAEKENREPEYLEHFTTHCMRHSFCTRLVKENVNIKSVQSLMGHANITTTLNIYTHDSLEQNREEIKKLETERVAL